ncbi:MAG: LysR family transcriptional regulator [Actinomycetota bacterium]
MRLDIDSLRTLRAIVESGSFTGAAARLHLTQSAVSWKIKRLEERLGHALLVRDGKSIEPTEMGHELLIHAEKILDAHDEAIASLKLRELTGTVRLGCNDEPDLVKFAEILRFFRVEHPRVRVNTRIALSSVVAAWLRAGELDLALLQVIADDVKEEDVIIRRASLDWFASPDLVLGDDGAIPLITFGSRGFYRPIAERALREAGFDFFVAVECESSASVLAAVEAGLGVTVLNTDHPVASNTSAQTNAIDLPGSLPEVCFVARRSKRTRDSAVRALQAALVAGFSPIEPVGGGD